MINAHNSVPTLRELKPAARKLDPATQQAAPPKKKRVRRQKLELDYLRDLVGKLEETLSGLKVKQLSIGNESIPTEVNTSSIWKDIAGLQQKERARAEEENRGLRSSLVGQLKLAMKLEGLLDKHPKEEEVMALAGTKHLEPSLNNAASPTEDDIFADQLSHVLHAHLDVDALFRGLEFADPTAYFCDLHVMSDVASDTGVAFVTKANSMLPFDVHVTGKAFWRMFGEGVTKKDSYVFDEKVKTTDLVAHSYGMHFDAGQFHANILGKETYRQYAHGDCVMIMWKWVVDPVEVNGIKFTGLRCHDSWSLVTHETGWVVLREVVVGGSELGSAAHCDNSRPMKSTVLQSYSKMTMELKDDITNPELQVGVLTDVVVGMHDTLTEVCGKIVTDMLVEEDCNQFL